jgi:site-specific DNA recombinase
LPYTPGCQPQNARNAASDARTTQDHEYKGQDAEVQLRELREYVEVRGWEITEVNTDTVTGSKDSRPGLNRLMADAGRRFFDLIVVWRFDRFARVCIAFAPSS